MQDNNQPNPIPEEIDPMEDEVFAEAYNGTALPEEGEIIDEEEPIEPLDLEPSTPVQDDVKVSESKTRQFFRRIFRWTAGVLIVFGLGLLTGIFLFYRPATKEAEQTSRLAAVDLSTAQDQITDLETEVAGLEAKIGTLQPLKDTNNDLLAAQKNLNLHIAILDTRLDVTNALLAISQEDFSRALVVLDKTSETLDQINSLMEPEQQELVTGMRDRLELVLSEIEGDPYAAQSDLDVLANNLLLLEDALITE